MGTEVFAQALHGLRSQALCWVEVADTQGSVPRERGAWMAVFADQVLGTIGGGHLEFQAIKHARQLLQSQTANAAGPARRRYPLGPGLGQCCGGAVELDFECLAPAELERLRQRRVLPQDRVALFGAGHVGHALVRLLADLPYQVVWVDSRDAVFPETVRAQLCCEHSEPVQAAVAHLPAQSQVVIMSFSHAEDLEVLAQCLKRQRERGDLPYIGLIGSATKWAIFKRRLAQRGFSEAEIAHVTCPIGVPGLHGKEPQVIAVAVAAQLLQRRVLA